MKFAPLIVTLVPPGPLEGVKLVMVGATTTAKLLALVAVPAGVFTLIGPVLAPATLFPYTTLFRSTVKLAALPLNVTAVAPMKFVPPIVTLVHRSRTGLETIDWLGATTAAKLLALVAVPAGVVTLRGPVVAPAGTVV